MKSLKQVEQTLRTTLGSQALFSLINTRLILRTGVDLATIAPAQDHDATTVGRVLNELKAMGYTTTPTGFVHSRGK